MVPSASAVSLQSLAQLAATSSGRKGAGAAQNMMNYCLALKLWVRLGSLFPHLHQMMGTLFPPPHPNGCHIEPPQWCLAVESVSFKHPAQLELELERVRREQGSDAKELCRASGSEGCDGSSGAHSTTCPGTSSSSKRSARRSGQWSLRRKPGGCCKPPAGYSARDKAGRLAARCQRHYG